jgi:membrane protease YdiL (CAAX protease family)
MASIMPEETGACTPAAQSWRKLQTLEVWVFLFLIVPSMAISLFAVRTGTVSFSLAAVSIIFRDLALVCLVLFFLWRNGEPRAKIGWNLEHLWAEVSLGLSLYVPFALSFVGVEWFFRRVGLSAPSTPLPSFLTVKDLPEILLAIILVSVVAVAEETIFRGYLLLRFGATTQNIALAVVFSSLVFSIGHGYEGSAGLASVGMMGVILSLIYLWRGSLVAPIVIHFLQDFVGIVLVSLLRLG